VNRREIHGKSRCPRTAHHLEARDIDDPPGRREIGIDSEERGKALERGTEPGEPGRHGRLEIVVVGSPLCPHRSRPR
jgi:hypothetical protein